MKKIMLFLLILCSVFLFFSPVNSEDIPEEVKTSLGQTAKALREYMEAWQSAYEWMAKYQEPYYTYDDSFIKGVSYVSEKIEDGNIIIIFYITNNSKGPH